MSGQKVYARYEKDFGECGSGCCSWTIYRIVLTDVETKEIVYESDWEEYVNDIFVPSYYIIVKQL